LKNVAMKIRRGIEGKREERERKRRREARENGVVLEKEARKKGKGRERRKDRGLGVGVGRWKAGSLVLSKRDVADIVGPKEGGNGSGKGNRKKRRK